MRFVKVLLVLMFASTSLSFALQEDKGALHLTLKQALKMAKANNAQVIASNERVRQALADMSFARSTLLPQITGIFGGKRQTQDMRASGIKLPGDPHVGPFNSFDTRGRLTMNIFDLEAIERLQSAKAGEKLSRAESVKVQEDVLALVGAMFLEAQRAHQSVELVKVSLRDMEYKYKDIQKRFAQGMASISDLNKAEVDLSQAQYSLQASIFHAQKSRLDLASALKIPLDQEVIFDNDQSWVRKELQEAQSLPDVALAQAQLSQSKANKAKAQAGFFPKITASGDYGRIGASPVDASNTYSIGVGVSIPIWEGGLRQAQLQQAKSKVKEQEVLLADAKDQSQVKIREARENLVQARAFLNTKIKQVIYAQHQVVLAQGRFKSGLGSQLELDEAQTQEALSLDDRNEALAVFWTAKINLAHTNGRIEDMFDLT
ncbi:MAG: TolC family protein [Candidatus Omnitrophota bacterium]